MWRAAIIWLALTGAVQAQNPAAAAMDAVEQLNAAGFLLADAKDAQDRVAALTKTVHAYEDGLAALRTGMRQAAIQEQAISADLETRREDVAQLLGVLSTLSRAPTPLLLLHPTGPTGTARSGMMLSEVTQGLQARAEALRLELEEVMILRDIQANAAATLVDGLTGAQQARVTLRTAMSDRTDLPRKFIEDPEQTALLIASSETLDAFASALVAQPLGDTAPTDSLAFGQLPSPVAGLVLRYAGEADAAGIIRPGTIMATRPRALVTSPMAATVRHVGPLLDLGNVVILEPLPDHLLILSGLAEVYPDIGEVLPAGAPVGLMGGEDGQVDTNFTDPAQGAGTSASETLYIELRNGQGPIDPAAWFALDEEVQR